MAEIRQRCQVLKAIAAIGECTGKDLEKHLPNLTPQQIQRACYNLAEDDEIRRVGEIQRETKNGRPWIIWKCRDEHELRDTSKKRVYKKTGRKSYAKELQRPMVVNDLSGRIVIYYRDRKIALLEKLLNHVGGTDKDLLIGIINDYRG